MNSRLAAVLQEEQQVFEMAFSGTPPRRADPHGVEVTTPTSPSSPSSTSRSRKFAPEPVETSFRSLRKTPQQSPEEFPGRSGDKTPQDDDPHTHNPKPRRRFVPEPVETLTRSNRGHGQTDGDSDTHGSSPSLRAHEEVDPLEDGPTRPARRKFKPDLIETARRSRRAGDTLPTMLPQDKTNISPGDLPIRPAPARPYITPLPPENTPNVSANQVPLLRPPANRQGSIKPHYTTRANTRQHSYRVPSLASIDSSESDESERPSVRQEDSDTSEETYKEPTRMRESVDERFTGYLLSLAARQAEKQLREQEAAAFPTSNIHRSIVHYMNRDDSDEDVAEPPVARYGRSDRARRDSEDEKQALRDMQQHAEKVYQQKQKQTRAKTKNFDLEFDSPQLNEDIWRTAGGKFAEPSRNTRKLIGGHQTDPYLKQMRKAASPPMLGDDLDFPRCRSPDNARFDVTQGADFLRKQMCYLSEQSQDSGGGLWAAQAKEQSNPAVSPGTCGGTWRAAPKSPEISAPPRSPGGGGGGLWGGLCTDADRKKAKPPLGLITPISTPQQEKDDPFAAMFSNSNLSAQNSHTNLASLGNGPVGPRPLSPTRSPSQSRPIARHRAPPSPPLSVGSTGSTAHLCPPPSALDQRLALEARVSSEFSDAFVTQVYNYLSLGYPSLARKFDDELVRISKFNVEDLRSDDKLAEARGHIRLGTEEVDGDEGLDEHSCKRWRALRRYVREWGRQMLTREMEGGVWGGGDPTRAWGVPARRGSWGL